MIDDGSRSKSRSPSHWRCFLPWWLLGVVACCLAGLAAAESTVTPRLPFVHFTPDHRQIPLTSSSVQKIHQDASGRLWLAFYTSGLSRIDGADLQTFDFEDGLPDPTVREIAEDRQGYLWVGTEAGIAVSHRSIHQDDPGRLRFRTRIGEIDLAPTRIRRGGLVADPQGGVWAVVAGEIVHYLLVPDGTLEVQRVDRDGEQRPVSRILAGRGGELWAGFQDVGMAKVSARSRRWSELSEEKSPTSPVTALEEGPDGTLWVGCYDGGVWRYDPGNSRFEPVNSQLAETIQSLLETSEGELWVGSLGSGLLRLEIEDLDQGHHITRRDGLPSETIWHVFQDEDDALWVGHNAGLSRLRSNHRAFRGYTGSALQGDRAALPDPTVFAVVSPRPDKPNDLLWVGTGGGLAAIDLASARAQSITLEQGLLSNSIYSLAREENGRLWVGTPAGLNILTFDGHRPKAITVALGQDIELMGRSATVLSYGLSTLYEVRIHRSKPMGPTGAEASQGGGGEELGVWLSGVDGVSAYVGGAWFLLGEASGLPSAGAITTAFDDQQHLWVGTKDSGVFRSTQPIKVDYLRHRLDDEAPHRQVETAVFEPVWNRRLGAPSNSVRRLVWVEGGMFVATPAGIDRLSGQPVHSVLHLDRRGGLGGDNAMGLVVDPASGHLWVAQNRGLAKVSLEGKVVGRLTRDDGLIDDEIWLPSALDVDAMGNVYFGTPKGLTLYRPGLDR